eukprot:scpid57447/ scgid25633/ Protein phosphatase 1B; Protein phosphatase 2C isoform beta
MGSFLDKPKTEKETNKGEGKDLRYGVAGMQGWRGTMEDAYAAEPEIKNFPGWAFFGVFDGHAGAKVADYVSKHLLDEILKTDEFSKPDADADTYAAGIRQGFLNLDESIKQQPFVSEDFDPSGSTVIVAMVSPTHVYFANCGDSRGMLCKKGDVAFATEDHKPSCAGEQARVQAAGGNVLCSRINGSLAVSRALGDFAFKRRTDKPAIEQMVSPEPEVTTLERTGDDEFILLACDGVWDVMANEDAAQYITERLRVNADLVDAISQLVDYSLHKESKDNMTAVLVAFPAAPKVDNEEVEKAKVRDAEVEAALEAKIREMVRTSDMLDDLDELSVINDLGRVLPDEYFTVSRREFICKVLEKTLADQDEGKLEAKKARG